ncbi:UbiH/UbiF/VisC/COQ6 family ubiquinone biosynthesis hydroxylase [Amylibacter sp.]|nr:UbiH/UbiF/VisC/COQ6 family ubiquinone biosynthesis hydroxylase [Amylibacter sp.]
MDYNTEILIVGGGLIGSAMAIALSSIGFDITVVDRQFNQLKKADIFDGRAYALSHASVRMLKALGLWDSIQKNTQPILDIKVSDGRVGEGASDWFLHFDHQELEEGPMGHLIEDRYIREAFKASISRSKQIEYIYGAEVVSKTVDDAGVNLNLLDGRVLRARLLIGCDGRNSNIAKWSDISHFGWDYNQTALVCALSHEKPHLGIAHQFFTPSGPLAILPLPDNKSSIVWTETKDQANIINTLDDKAYLAAISPVIGDFLGRISLVGDRFSYPLGLSIADKFAINRTVLVGDSAHGIHPLAGQGLNLGLKDIAALTEVLALAKRRGENFASKDVLERYQKWRRFDTSAMALATDSINKLFSNDNSILRSIRDIGLGGVNSTPQLRRSFMRHAAGLSGDLPKLMQGQVI